MICERCPNAGFSAMGIVIGFGSQSLAITSLLAGLFLICEQKRMCLCLCLLGLAHHGSCQLTGKSHQSLYQVHQYAGHAFQSLYQVAGQALYQCAQRYDEGPNRLLYQMGRELPHQEQIRASVQGHGLLLVACVLGFLRYRLSGIIVPLCHLL